MDITSYFKKTDEPTLPDSPVNESTKRALSEGASPGLYDAKKLHANFDSLSNIDIDFDKEPFWVPLLFAMVDNIKQGQAAICADIASIRASVDELAIFKQNVEEHLSAVETSVQRLSDSFDEQAKDIVKLKADLKRPTPS